MSSVAQHSYNQTYAGSHLNHIAFPLGGIGAGMICLEGAGGLTSISIRGRAEVFHEPLIFSAISIGNSPKPFARLLQGPVPDWKILFPWGERYADAGSGGRDRTYGLPRFKHAEFHAHFPFAEVRLDDPELPLEARITGWSPFTPGNADDSSLPLAALEYTFRNKTNQPVEAIYSFHAKNFLRDYALDNLLKEKRPAWGTAQTDGGFVLYQEGTIEQPWARSAFAASTDAPGAAVNCRWFRGGWFDPATIVWKSIANMQALDAPPYSEGDPSPGGSLYVPLKLDPGAQTTVRIMLSWYCPVTNIREGKGPEDLASTTPGATCGCASGDCAPAAQATHRPWYAGNFKSNDEVNAFWRGNYNRLRNDSQRFTDCFYDTTLPAEVIEAVAANLSILKSPTVHRQTDGRLWLWEGCHDDAGCCSGSCTHVWNYAQAIAHLFPDLERTLRETEFGPSQDQSGHQQFRSALPIRPTVHDHHAAADGQFGGIMKVYREWRINSDTNWLKQIWPQVRQSLDYCIATWDPDHEGLVKEPHHNTYDIEFWGPDGMCGSFYAGALEAACLIGEALNDPTPLYAELYDKAKRALERDLFDGEYFIQKIRWTDLHAAPPSPDKPAWNLNYSPEATELLQKEGPKYQYGKGCLSDGVLGAWIAKVCGVGDVLDHSKVRSHVKAVHKYNFRTDLSKHANMQRPSYALGTEAGLLLCSWPKGGALSLPFVYSDEVWTGIEYQVASHLMLMGCVEEGLQIVRAVRDRYDGRVRNPFSEYECGHWYGRALSSYGLLQGLTGQRYDAVDKTLYLSGQLGNDWKAFLSTASGYGTIGMRQGKPFVEVKHGTIPIDRIEVNH